MTLFAGVESSTTFMEGMTSTNETNFTNSKTGTERGVRAIIYT